MYQDINSISALVEAVATVVKIVANICSIVFEHQVKLSKKRVYHNLMEYSVYQGPFSGIEL